MGDRLLAAETLKINLRRAKAGDRLVREDFLENSKPFILKVVAKLCRRVLNWGVDDELSIGLIAMNEAIDGFDERYRVPFLAYARLIIKNRVTDYFRQESRYARINLSLHGVEELGGESPVEIARAWEDYLSKETAREREIELLQYEAKLKQYKISFKDLVRCSPKHGDSRTILLKIAEVLASRKELMKYVQQKKRLPIQELVKLTGIHRKTLERGRKYIIAIALVFHHREEFVYLNWYLKRN